jgi:hypothetical protein
LDKKFFVFNHKISLANWPLIFFCWVAYQFVPFCLYYVAVINQVVDCLIFSAAGDVCMYVYMYVCIYVYMYVCLAVYSYITFVGRPRLSTLSQNVSMRLFLRHSNQIFLSPSHYFPTGFINIFVAANVWGNAIGPQSCIPVLNTVPLVTKLDRENGNVHKRWRCTYNIRLL